MRVFLSSTVFDLIDVRNEIAELLRSLGITPVLSDDKLSDFAIKFDANSIETCLVNVESCDEVIVVLDKRYGPSLGGAGFEDVSASHLEYLHAVKHKKPIHFYVRDRLEADYAIWKKNRRKDDVDLTWVTRNNYGLFKMLDKHSKLKACTKASNWYTSFTSSVDLKASLRHRFEMSILPQRVVDAIGDNKFPLFDVHVDVDFEPITTDHLPNVTFKCLASNVGGAAAFNFIARWKDKSAKGGDAAIMTPGQSLLLCLFGRPDPQVEIEEHLSLEYESAIGVAVVDDFHVGGSILPGTHSVIMAGATLEKRTFRRVERPLIEIEDS